MAKVRAGELNKRILIQRPVAQKNRKNLWEDWLTVSAKVNEQPGGEEFVAEQESTEQIFLFTVRFNNAIDDSMRVEYPIGGGRHYHIESISEIGVREGMMIKGRFVGGRD
jgi:SPP1 family predicted phage head-tail adaptor